MVARDEGGGAGKGWKLGGKREWMGFKRAPNALRLDSLGKFGLQTLGPINPKP